MVQGEPILDVPVDDCPGEIGVVCFQVSIIPEKQKEKELDKGRPKPTKEEVKVGVRSKGPADTEDFISIEQINVPEAFLNSTPNPEKTQKVVDYVKRTGYLDEPITINRETKVLTDGYRRYIVVKKVKLDAKNKFKIFYETTYYVSTKFLKYSKKRQREKIL